MKLKKLLSVLIAASSLALVGCQPNDPVSSLPPETDQSSLNSTGSTTQKPDSSLQENNGSDSSASSGRPDSSVSTDPSSSTSSDKPSPSTSSDRPESSVSADRPDSSDSTASNSSEDSQPAGITKITIDASKTDPLVGETVTLGYELEPNDAVGEISYEIIEGQDKADIEGNQLTFSDIGTVKVIAKCGNISSDPLTITSSFGTINWSGLTELKSNVGELSESELLEGVSAENTAGIAAQVRIDTNDLTEILAQKNAGTYEIEYQAYLNETLVGIKTRQISLSWINLIQNWDFSDGIKNWMTNASDICTVIAENGELHYQVTDTGSEAFAIQTEYNPEGGQRLEFKSGETYRISVKARATENSIGKSIALGFEDKDNGYNMLTPCYVEYAMTADMSEYVSYFTADRDYSNIKAVAYLGRGLDKDDEASAENPLEFWLDDFKVEKINKGSAELQNVYYSGNDRIQIENVNQVQQYKGQVKASLNDQDVTGSLQWYGSIPETISSGISRTNFGLLAVYTEENGAVSYGYVPFEWRDPRTQKDYDYEPFNSDFNAGFECWTPEINPDGNFGTGTLDYIDNKDGTVTMNVHADGQSGHPDWSVQLHQSSSKLLAGHKYRIKITAKVVSDNPDSVILRTEFNGDQHKTDIRFGTEFTTVYSDILTVDSDLNNVRTGLLMGENTVSYSITFDEFTVEEVID